MQRVNFIARCMLKGSQFIQLSDKKAKLVAAFCLVECYYSSGLSEKSYQWGKKSLSSFLSVCLSLRLLLFLPLFSLTFVRFLLYIFFLNHLQLCSFFHKISSTQKKALYYFLVICKVSMFRIYIFQILKIYMTIPKTLF